MKIDYIGISILIGTIAIVLFVGILILQKMNDSFVIAKGFCIDKEGMINLSQYYDSFEYKGMINCSNKKMPYTVEAIA